MYQLPSAKYWNTWSSESPAIMEFLPAGFSVRLGAYSFKDQSYTPFPFSREMSLFEHHPDGRYCRLRAGHSDTLLELEYFKSDDWTVIGRLRCVKSGEWGLRFWPLLGFGFIGEGDLSRDGLSVAGKLRSLRFAVALKDAPVRSCLAADADAVGKDMVSLGYYAPMSDAADPHWFTAAYNLEETPEICFAVSVANNAAQAREKAEGALALASGAEDGEYPALRALRDAALAETPRQVKGDFPSALEAMRDVMAWNGIADRKNGRVFTSLTRFWIDKKFGGWFVWLDDVFMHSLINAYAGDWTMARNNIKTALDNQVPAGNLACLMSEFTEWVDRSQPPIFAFMVYKYFLLSGDRQLLEEAYPALLRAHRWWYANRDGNSNGVLEYGSSRIGEGHFNGTKLAAKDEAAMDNSPMFDCAKFVPERNTIDMEDVALNCLLALDGECLGLMAEVLGRTEDSDSLRARTARLRRDVDARLWDEDRKLYANRHWEKGFVCPSPTSFYPLAAGIPNAERVAHLVRHIFDETEFWTKAPLPSVWLKDPAVNDNVYWRGRSWPPLNFFTYVGLKRNGLDEEAHRLARRIMENFDEIWRNERRCYENHNAISGQGGDSVDADPFYGWGALHPLMWLLEHIDVDPWNGFHFGSVDGSDYELRDLKMRDGSYSLFVTAGETRLSMNGRTIFSSNAKGRFRHFARGDHYASVELGPRSESRLVSFPGIRPFKAAIDGKEIPAAADITVAAGPKVRIEFWY
jgi:putative isomerase